jgi:Sec-independent protein translocase protein TatA
MLGISGAEFLVILIVAMAIVPAKHWPAAARMLARALRWGRNAIARLQDGIDNLENEMAKQAPVDSLSQRTMDDLTETFSSPLKSRTRAGNSAKPGRRGGSE